MIPASRFIVFGLLGALGMGCDSQSGLVVSGDSATANEYPKIDRPVSFTAAAALESDIDAWQLCSSASGIGSTGEIATGNHALVLTGESCVYQTVLAVPGDSYQLTCQSKNLGGGWAALALAYLDDDYKPVRYEERESQSQEMVTSNITLTAPDNTSYVEVLAYTTGSAELWLDDCKLVNNNTDLATGISNQLADDVVPVKDTMKSLPSFGTDANDIATDGHIDWAEARMAHNNLGLWIDWDTYAPVDPALWGLGIYLDTDQDRSTGFRGFSDEYPIGVDYLVEGVEHFTYTGNGNNWSWQQVPSVQGGAANTLVTGIPIAQLAGAYEIDLFFAANNEAVGGKTIDFYPDGVTDSNAADADRYFTYKLGSRPDITVARIDARNNLEGDDRFQLSGSWDSELSVTNRGQVTLYDVSAKHRDTACDFGVAELAPEGV